jgi:hypothetical protein
MKKLMKEMDEWTRRRIRMELGNVGKRLEPDINGFKN